MKILEKIAEILCFDEERYKYRKKYWKKIAKIIEKLPKYWRIRINQRNYEKIARFSILLSIFSRKFWQKIVEFFDEISS